MTAIFISHFDQPNNFIIYFRLITHTDAACSQGGTPYNIFLNRAGNIIWINDWLENLQVLGVGNFDFVQSAGVLHHLKHIESGMSILKDSMPPQGGGMWVMLYGRIGRSGVYLMQMLLRLILAQNSDTSYKLRIARGLIKRLPTTNWFRVGEENVSDHKRLGDSGTYDLLLHNRDMGFDNLEVEAIILNSGLYLVRNNNFCRNNLCLRNDEKLSETTKHIVKDNSLIQKQAINELFFGNVIKHEIAISLLSNYTNHGKEIQMQ